MTIPPSTHSKRSQQGCEPPFISLFSWTMIIYLLNNYEICNESNTFGFNRHYCSVSFGNFEKLVVKTLTCLTLVLLDLGFSNYFLKTPPFLRELKMTAPTHYEPKNI